MKKTFGKLNKKQLRELHHICEERDMEIYEIWMYNVLSFDTTKIEECYDKYNQYILDKYGQEYLDFIEAKEYFDSLDENI